MKEKILFVSVKSPLAEKYSQIIASEYTLERRYINAKSLYRELNDISLIVVYTTAMRPEEYQLLYTFLTVMPERFVPLMLFGSAVERKNFRSAVNYPVQFEIDNSAEKSKLCKEIQNILERNSNHHKKKETVLIVPKKIFVVDENLENLQNLKALLSKDYEVSILNSIPPLFHLLKQKHPDLLLLRYHANKHSACIRTLTRLRSNDAFASLPVILLGDVIASATLNELLPYKIKGYLTDSASKQEFLDTIAAKI